MFNVILRVCVTVLLVGGRIGDVAIAQTENDTSAEPAYQVVDGKVDARIYVGWRVFHSVCHGCHGVDATGTSVAPDLTASLEQMSARHFSTKVLTRYRITAGFDAISGDDTTALREAFLQLIQRRERGELIMPAWGGDSNVKPHLLDLYAYLKARADGVLGAGRPERLSQ